MVTISVLFLVPANVRPVCLPNKGMYFTAPQECYITGWGSLSSGGLKLFDKSQQNCTKTHTDPNACAMIHNSCMTSKCCFLKGSSSETLQEAKIQLIDRTTCNSRPVYNRQITDTMICAGKLEGGVDSCQVRNTLCINTVRSCLISQRSKLEYCKCNVCAIGQNEISALPHRGTVGVLWSQKRILYGGWLGTLAGVMDVLSETSLESTEMWPTSLTGYMNKCG